MEDKDQALAEIVAKNVKSLLTQSRITISGLAEGTSVSINHLRTIIKGEASITGRTAGKIAYFFEIEVGQLFSSAPIQLKDIELIDTIRKFYEGNSNNPQYFEDRKTEKSVSHYIENQVVPSGFLAEERSVYEVVKKVNSDSDLESTSKEVSRILTRLTAKGILEKEMIVGNKKRFKYIVANKGKTPLSHS